MSTGRMCSVLSDGGQDKSNSKRGDREHDKYCPRDRMLSFCLVGVDPTKQKNRIHMTSLDQNVMGWTAGIPEAVKLMKSAALKLYAEVADKQVPGVQNYTFGDYIEHLASRASDGDQGAAATLGAMIDAAAEMQKMISEDLQSRC